MVSPFPPGTPGHFRRSGSAPGHPHSAGAAFANVIACYYTMPMKHPEARSRSTGPLLEALLAMRSPREMRAFLDDLCTPAELEAITDRWRVVPLLLQKAPYREIHDRTGVSV